ncbi:tetraspanin-33 [Rhipicephalus sanguineus]|uniref:tetraspanin-33 n=1 Tax=Rhipicephalus sanguineus TaxID=34632 RepID=UPI0020C32A4B|nr:tetraspanin-33 [Rhipicephalus sanguineus]
MSVHVLLKGLLFLMNFIYWFFGGTTMLMGGYLLTVKVRILRRYVDLTFDPAVFFIVVGCLVFVIAGFGCVGALRENKNFLCLYGFSLSGIVVAVVLVAVLAFVWSTSTPPNRSGVEKILRRAVVIYRDDPDMEHLINAIQSSLSCCGISSRGYLDWQHNAYFNCSPLNPSRERCGVPYSCCREQRRLPNVMCGYGVTDTTKRTLPSVEPVIYTQGCLQALIALARENSVLVSVLSAVTVGSLAVGIAGSWLLMKSVTSQRRAVVWESAAVSTMLRPVSTV